MSVRELGVYIEKNSGKQYTVLERTKELSYRPLKSGNKITSAGSIDYVTSCGIDLEPMDDELNQFELIQIDGGIKRQ